MTRAVYVLAVPRDGMGITEGKGGEVPFPIVAERLPDSQRRRISSEPLGRPTSAEEGQPCRNATSLPLCTRESNQGWPWEEQLRVTLRKGSVLTVPVEMAGATPRRSEKFRMSDTTMKEAQY